MAASHFYLDESNPNNLIFTIPLPDDIRKEMEVGSQVGLALYINQYQNDLKTKANKDIQNSPAFKVVSEGLEEFVKNSMHAGASELTIKIKETHGVIEIELHDNGNSEGLKKKMKDKDNHPIIDYDEVLDSRKRVASDTAGRGLSIASQYLKFSDDTYQHDGSLKLVYDKDTDRAFIRMTSPNVMGKDFFEYQRDAQTTLSKQSPTPQNLEPGVEVIRSATPVETLLSAPVGGLFAKRQKAAQEAALKIAKETEQNKPSLGSGKSSSGSSS